MVDKDILFEKVNSIEKCLKRIRSVASDLSRLEDFTVQDIVVLNLQRAVQLVIDCAFHIASQENMGSPKNLRDVFSLLRDNGVIDSKLTEKMEKMVGFRNIAVHEYQSINFEILNNILKNHLSDFEEFYSVILKKF